MFYYIWLKCVCSIKITCSDGAGPLVATASNSPLFDTFHWLNINVQVADAFRHVAVPAFNYIIVSCCACACLLCLLASSVFGAQNAVFCPRQCKLPCNVVFCWFDMIIC